MIEGLQVTVSATELRELCVKRAAYHRERAAVYSSQVADMQANEIERMRFTGGDPVRALESRREQHESDASELEFIAAHLVANEEYRLDLSALAKLGIVTRSF